MASWDSKASGFTVTHQTNEDVFPLLQLPRELRNMIYSEVLVQSSEDQKILINGGCTKPSNIDTRWWQQQYQARIPTALMKANRQVRCEALGYLHGNFFGFDHLLGLCKFLDAVHADAIVHLQHITIRSHSLWFENMAEKVFALLQDV